MHLPSIKSRFWLYALLFIVGLFFLFCHERYLSGADPANFVLAIKYGYSVQQERPHAPGYSGFYLLWKGIEFITDLGPHNITSAANLIFLLTAILLIYYAGKRIFDEKTAILASTLAATNPLLLYFACTTELYVYDAALSAFLVIMLLASPRKFHTALYLLYGILGAFRLSSVILTFPVVIVTFYMRHSKGENLKLIARDMCAILLGTLAWLIPFTIRVGGLSNFIQMIDSVASVPPTTFSENISALTPIHLWMINILLLLIVLNIKKIWQPLRSFDKRYIVLILLIVLPGLYFFLKFYAKGYALIYIAPIMLICARLIVQSRRRYLWAISAVAINLLIFFAVPFKSPSARSVLNHANRTMSERWATALWRSTSFFAPTFAHLRMNDRMAQASNSVLDSIAPCSYVIVDGSAAALAHPRSMQAGHPFIAFLAPRPEDSTFFRFFSFDSTGYFFNISRLSHEDNLYYLTTADFAREAGKPPGYPMLQNGPFELYNEPVYCRDSLVPYLSDLFFIRH